MTKVASLFGLESLTVLWTGSCCALHRPRGEIKSFGPFRVVSCTLCRVGGQVAFSAGSDAFKFGTHGFLHSRPGTSRDSRPSRVVRGTSGAAAPPARLPSGERPGPDRAGCLLSGLGPWPLPFGMGPVRPNSHPSGPQLKSRWACPPLSGELSESRVPTVTGQIVRRSIRLRASPRPAGRGPPTLRRRGTSLAAAPHARLPSDERPRPLAEAGSGRLPALGTWPMASTFRYWPRASDYSPFRAAAQVTLGLPASRWRTIRVSGADGYGPNRAALDTITCEPTARRPGSPGAPTAIVPAAAPEFGLGLRPVGPGHRLVRLAPAAAAVRPRSSRAVSSPSQFPVAHGPGQFPAAHGPSVPRVSSPWLTGRQCPWSVPRGSRAVSSPGQIPSAHGPSASESDPVAHRPSVPRVGAVGAGPGRYLWPKG